jgi:hypothetical protein
MVELEHRIIQQFSDSNDPASTIEERHPVLLPESAGVDVDFEDEQFDVLERRVDALDELIGSVVGALKGVKEDVAALPLGGTVPPFIDNPTPNEVEVEEGDYSPIFVKLKFILSILLPLKDDVDDLRDAIDGLRGSDGSLDYSSSSEGSSVASGTSGQAVEGIQGPPGPLGPPPEHEVDTTGEIHKVRFEVSGLYAQTYPDCTTEPDENGRYWGPWLDLPRGPKGDDGDDGLDGVTIEKQPIYTYDTLKVEHNNYHHYYCP